MKAPVARIAWMGGSRPAKSSTLSRGEAQLRKQLFRDQVKVWRDYWGDSPMWDTLRIYFNRARYDAHATLRV